jgi:hypothetical protein
MRKKLVGSNESSSSPCLKTYLCRRGQRTSAPGYSPRPLLHWAPVWSVLSRFSFSLFFYHPAYVCQFTRYDSVRKLLGVLPTPELLDFHFILHTAHSQTGPDLIGFDWNLPPVRSSKRNRLLSLERRILHWNSLSMFHQLHLVKQIGWRTEPHYLVPL